MRTEDTQHLAEGPYFCVMPKVMENQARDHSVEARVRIWQLVSVTHVETNPGTRLARLLSSNGENLGIRIEADDVDVRVLALDKQIQSASSAAYVQNALLGLDPSLIDQPFFPQLLAHRQTDERVVQASEEAKPEGGNEWSPPHIVTA